MMQLISRLGMCVILLAAFGVASACLSISVSHASDVSYGVVAHPQFMYQPE
jgi:hypothetical protein